MARKLSGILKTWVCTLAALGLGASGCLGQQYSFSTITAGLGNLNINCIVQDRSGYLWVGTQNGLYRYDGQAFRQFGAADGLQGHIIQSLFAAQDGTLFVGTTTGIYFEQQEGRFAQIYPPEPVIEFSQRIGSVFSWLAPGQVVTADRTGAFLLRRMGPDKWAAEPMHLDGTSIWSVLAGPDGVIWYGCDLDLCRLENGRTTHLGAALHLPEEHWMHLLLSRNGHLWMRGATNLVEVVPAENRFEARDLPGRSIALPYAALTQDALGRIVASQGSAFGLWGNGNWRMVTTANGLSRYDIADLFVDREGSLWIGVVGHGLMRWVGQDQWEGYTAASGLSDNIVWATLRDRSGRLWIGTESGLDFLPPGENSPKPWGGDRIQTARSASLAECADGSIWMGSAAGNLVRIHPTTLSATQWPVPEVFRVLCDAENRVWVATDEGLYGMDIAAGDRAPRLVEDAGIARPLQRFSDLSLDPANRLWAATDEGIYGHDPNGWHRIDPGLSGVAPYQIAADAKGNLWAAGAFPGVMRLRIAEGRVVESEHIVPPQLLSEQVVSLALDRRGWLWVGQDAGLTVFDGLAWRSYTQDDGLIWNDTDSYALAEDRDGSMWIGTSGGLSHLLRPASLVAGTPAPPVFSRITFGTENIANNARIPWSASSLVISIAALSYRNAGRLRIRYRLLGVEPEWVETAERTVRYARLEPGAYRFQAVAMEGSGGAISSVEEFSFVITPRWWQSGPLRLALVLLTAIVVVLAWRWSVQLLVRQKRHLEQAVVRRTEDLEREKTELLHAREQMRYFAEHDDLTGLWNHRTTMERLRQEVDRSLRQATPLSLILVDLDHFKSVNDTFGHPAGDLVLKEIGAILLRLVRSYDWVGRYGGEEFLMILPGSSFSGARIRAEQLRVEVETAIIHDGERAISLTASFGVASGFPPDSETLVRVADAALYQAKNNGRNCVIATEIESVKDAGETHEMAD